MRLGSDEIVTGRPTNTRLVLMRPPIIATARRGKQNKESNQAGAGKAIVLKQGTDNPGNERTANASLVAGRQAEGERQEQR